MRPRLSVVVPFYGVERYFAECLDSLQEQSMDDFEAILIDDGSMDGSLAIAEKYVAADDRFRIVRHANLGLGLARNTGVREAVGEYLTFVDSDDVVPPYAYQRMVTTLDRTGSDMVSGDARRFNDLGVRDSWVHRGPFSTRRLGTHVRDFHPLALDRMAWNKVYRRSFWDEQDLAFPGGLYEDYPVTIRSHVLARQVDVLAAPVYYWRERDGGDLSITQRVWELANLRDRVSSALNVLRFLRDESPELRPVVERHLLQIDVAALVGALHGHDPSDHPEVLDLARQLVAAMSPETADSLGPFDRIQSDLVRRGRLRELAELTDYRARNGTVGELERRGWIRSRYYRRLPFLDDDRVGVRRHLYRVSADRVSFDGAVLDATWDGDTVVVDVRAGIGTLILDPDPRVRCWLVGPSGRRVGTAVDVVSGPHRHKVDLRVRVRPADLIAENSLGHWRLEFEIRTGRTRRRGVLRTMAGARGRWSEQREVGRGVWAKPMPGHDGFGISLRQAAHGVAAVDVDGAVVTVSGWYTPPDDSRGDADRPVVWLRLADGDEAVMAELETGPAADGPVRPAGTCPFYARIDARRIASHGLRDKITERSVWHVRFAQGIEPPTPLIMPTGVPPAGVVVGERRVTVLAGAGGHVSVHEEYAHPVVDRVSIETGELMRFNGQWDRGGPRPDVARLRRYVTPADPVTFEAPIAWKNDRFVFDAPLLELARLADAVDVENEGATATPWSVLVVDPMGRQTEPVLLDVAAAYRLPGETRVSGRNVRVFLGRMARLGVVIADA